MIAINPTSNRRCDCSSCRDTLSRCATADANVLEVEHVRTGTTIRVDEVEIGLQLETRGHEHCEDVLRALRTKGYQLKFG